MAKKAAGGAQRPLGYRAEQVVAFTLRYFSEHRRIPTQAEICLALGIGTKGEISRIERGLRAHGLTIKRKRGKQK